jgi:hypothetical protein
VTDSSDQPVLDFVDAVLGDLMLRGHMFVGRRPDAGGPGMVIIQSGEEGRYELALPDLASPTSIEAFVARIQAHLAEVFGVPVPACPVHAHSLPCRAGFDGASWVCPDGEWSSPVGEYEERNWPPPDLSGADIASAVAKRLSRRAITGVRTVDAYLVEDGWVVLIGVWPLSDALTAQLREAAAPFAVEVRPEPGQWFAA